MEKNNCQLEKREVDLLIQKFGSPIYVFHMSEFEKTYKSLLNTFRAVYPKYEIAYSYKTNYTPQICKLVKKYGGLAEVVSDMEYRLAKKIGYTNEKIIYNGPVKGDGLFEHLMLGGIANIDSIDELKHVINFARQYPDKIFEIAFRVNIDIGQGFISRFGIDAYENTEKNSELNNAFEMVKETNVRVVGLHCHVGRSRSIIAWQRRVQVMFKLIDRHFEEEPKFIDFGSGMNSVMEQSLAIQFDNQIPSFFDYSNIVAAAMRDKYGHLPLEKQPTLYTEPGTTIVSGSMTFLSTVECIKTVKGKTYVIFDSSSGNIGDICRLKRLPISVYRNGSKSIDCVDADFVGYTCLEHDVMFKGYNGEIAVGDIVQFRNIGSYSNVFKPPFILPNCAMVQIDEGKNVECIKERETFNDVFRTYIF